MENTVTLTLEKYHELLDKSEELSSLKTGKIQLTYTTDTYHRCDVEVVFLDNNDTIEELKGIAKESNRIYNEELFVCKEYNGKLINIVDDLRQELSQIKNHWAYKLFINKNK